MSECEPRPVNKCLGCSACCSNVYMTGDSGQLEQSFPNAVKLDSPLEAPSLDEVSEGVFLAPYPELGENISLAVVAGRCPNLTPTGECEIYPIRPEPCRKFERGSKECIKSRHKTILSPVELGK